MSTLTSIPISDPKRFLALQDDYKQELMGDQRLEEASALAARRQLLLENKNVDPNWALPQVKAMSRKLNGLTRKIRQPFGTAVPTEVEEDDDAADDFAAGPVQAMVKRFLKPSKSPETIKKTPPNPKVKQPRVQHTPVVTPSPRRPKPPATPITGLELVKYGDYQETPEERIDRIWNQTALSLSPPPKFALDSPPPVRRQSPAQRTLPLSAPTFDYPRVAQAAYDQEQAVKGVKRKKRPRDPSKERQKVKQTSHTPVAKRTRQAAKKKEKSNLLKSWIEFKS